MWFQNGVGTIANFSWVVGLQRNSRTPKKCSCKVGVFHYCDGNRNEGAYFCIMYSAVGSSSVSHLNSMLGFREGFDVI